MARTGSGRRSRKAKQREALSCERIEEAALDLIEAQGLDGFSFRKLAAALGCEAMSLYHYFPSKAHLMDALLNRTIAGFSAPSRELPWPERLRLIAWQYRAWALRYPRFFQYAALHRMNTAPALALLENFISMFRDAGFDTESAARLFRVLGYYLLGAALDESGGYAKGPSAVDPVADDVTQHDYPEITAANPYFKPRHHEATFALGLDMLLHSIEQAARAAKTDTPGRRSRLPRAASR